MTKVKKKLNTESIILGAGHALILSHLPSKLSMAQVNDKIENEPQDVAQFGLFDNATPNYSTYYPEVTAEDLEPQDSEFIEPVFRMLSNVTVHAHWNPVYFSEEVLKRGMYKLVGQTVNIDHEMAVGNAIGSVKSVEWQDSYTTKGVKVPAGINAVLKIDGKSNPRIARGIMMDPPSIHSNSVTINFTWEKSHPEMEDQEFYSKLGTYDKNKKFIQKVVTEIKGFHETSLVSHGADPFAQRIKDGKINNPSYAGDRYQFSAVPSNGTDLMWDWKSDKGFNLETLSNSEDNTNGIINNNNNNDNIQNSEQMNELLRFLEKFFSLEADSLTKDNVQEKLGEIDFAALQLKAQKADEPVKALDLVGLTAITNEITALRKFKEETPEDLEVKLSMATIGETTLKELRAETTRLYGLTVEEGKEDPGILSLIDGADHTTLTSLKAQYEKLADGQFQFTCSSCGSHDVTRASANPSYAGDKHKTNAEIRNKLTGAGKAKLPSWMDE